MLIVESTFGVITLPPKEERESRFTATVEDIVTRGGSCLIPVFALGRAQELLLILDEYWQEHPELQGVPVFYASKLASKVGVREREGERDRERDGETGRYRERERGEKDRVDRFISDG